MADRGAYAAQYATQQFRATPPWPCGIERAAPP